MASVIVGGQWVALALALAFEVATGVTPAQFPPALTESRTVRPEPVEFVLPADTIIELTASETVSSRVAQRGQFFALTLREPIRVGDRVVVHAGAAAVGQVVHVDRSRMGGKAGELIVSARFLRVGDEQVPLRSSFGQAGASRTGTAIAATLAAGFLGLLVHGKDIELQAGTPVSARLATAWSPPPSSAPPLSPPPSPDSVPNSTSADPALPMNPVTPSTANKKD